MHGRSARGRRHAAVPPRRRARDRRARLRHRGRSRASTRSSGPAIAYVAAAKALVSADCAIDFFAGPSEILIVSRAGPAGMDRRRPHRAGRARPGRARNFRHAAAAASRARSPPRSRRQMPLDGPARAPRSGRNGAIIVTRTLDEAIALSDRMAPEHVVCDSDAQSPRLNTRRDRVRRALQRAGFGRLRDRLESRAADERRRTRARGAHRSGLRARVDRARLTAAGLSRMAPTAMSLATAEGLRAHAARSIRMG